MLYFYFWEGSNLRSIINNSRDYNFPVNIKLIITNNKNALGINFAKKFSIPYKVIDKNKSEFEKVAIKELKERRIDLLCLAGFMKILTKNFLRKFSGKIINIHPSLLPKYKGLNTFSRAIEKNETETGCTVHWVNEKLDGGIIIKKRVKINKSEDIEQLVNRVSAKNIKPILWL